MLKKLSQISGKEKLIILFVLGYVSAFLFFYPRFYVSTDEHEYLYNSYLLRKGSLIVEDKTLTPFGLFNGQGYISSYYIGKSIFLVPFTFLGWRAVFLSGLVIHLLNGFIFYKILKRLDLDGKNVLLYLFYPAFFWNSRTLGNELLVLTCVLGAFYFYLSEKAKDHIFSGLMFGLACVVRYETLLLFLCFAIVSLLKKKKKVGYMLIGFAPIALLILLFNNTYYGGFFGTGYGIEKAVSSGGGGKNPLRVINYFLEGGSGLFFGNLLTYLIMLSIVYPAMLFSPFSYDKNGRLEIFAAMFVYLLFYSHISGVSRYPILSPVTLTAHLRYFIPVLGLLLIPYAQFYPMMLERLHINEKTFFWIAIFGLFVGGLYMSQVHYEFLEGRRGVLEQIYKNTGEGSLILGASDDGIYVMPSVFGDRRYLEIETKSREDIEGYIDDNTYVLYLRYTTQVGKRGARAEMIAKSREKAKKFVEANRASLKLIYNATEPHFLEIYKFEVVG